MMKVRRPKDVFVRLADIPQVSIDGLVQGEFRHELRPQPMASTPIGDGEEAVSEAELRLLVRAAAHEWTPAGALAEEVGVDVGAIQALVDRRLLLSDRDEPSEREARERETRYQQTFWHPQAAALHFNGKWRDRTGDMQARIAEIEGFPEPAPDVFFDHEQALRREALPTVDESRPLHDVLAARRTTRSFDTETPLALSEFSAVLFHTYGCMGENRNGLYDAIKKTSPSGGALHPVEAYPLVRNVEGLSPGIYHYNVRAHALDLLSEMTPEEAEARALSFLAGQFYLAPAHAHCLLVARFYRHNWKYRAHLKAYKVVLMDASHLSQTFFLVCTERGLGAYFTAAINESNIEEELGLDPLTEGVVGISGVGISKDPDPLEFHTTDYRP